MKIVCKDMKIMYRRKNSLVLTGRILEIYSNPDYSCWGVVVKNQYGWKETVLGTDILAHKKV